MTEQNYGDLIIELKEKQQRLQAHNTEEILRPFGYKFIKYAVRSNLIDKSREPLFLAWLDSVEYEHNEERRQLDITIAKATQAMNRATWVIGIATIITTLITIFNIYCTK